MQAVEWFTASVVDTGKKIMTEKDTKSKISEDPTQSEDRIERAVKGTFWRIDEGMFRSALVLHVWLRCGQKLSIDDPAIILGSVHASMIHDALSLLRNSTEAQDKSQASVLNVSRSAYAQAILFCVKLGDIAMSNVCDTNFVWTVIDNFSLAHILLNVTIKPYGIAERMLAPMDHLLSNNGVCVPHNNHTVLQYYCAVVREALTKRNGDMPWTGKVNGGTDWLNVSMDAVTNTTIKAGRPAEILNQILVQNTSFRTPIGLELLEVTKGGKIAYLAYYYSCMSFGKHFDNRFIEAVSVLFARTEYGAKIRDAGPQISGMSGTIPQYLIDKAWDIIVSVTSCNEQRLLLLKEAYDQVVTLRSTSAVRYIAKTAYDQLQSDADINPSTNYSRYIEFRLIDGWYILLCMLHFLHETGRPEHIDSAGVKQILEAAVLFVEESSRERRRLDDEGYGYWSCLSKDEKKARNFGIDRAILLYRNGWDELSASVDKFAAIYSVKVIFRHNFNGLPGTAPWLAFQQLLESS